MEHHMIWPVQPPRGVRGADDAGDGAFGAPRGKRTHTGVDLAAEPHDCIVAPFEAMVTHVGIAYAGATLGSLHLTGTDGKHWAKILYVDPHCREGGLVVPGQAIGRAQDVATYYKRKGTPGMKNHVHLELRIDGKTVDPVPHLESA